MIRQPPRHIYRQPNVLATETQAIVKWFDPVRGFGFVCLPNGSPDALLPRAVVEAAGHEALPDGATVVVDLVEGKKGAQVSALHSVDTSTATPPRPRPGAGPRPSGGFPPRERGGFDRGGFDRGPANRGSADRGSAERGGFERGAADRPQRRAAPTGPTGEADGTVKWFDTVKGYGFIAPDSGGRDVFVHVKAVERGGLSAIAEGQRVHVTFRQGERGPEAVTVSGA